LTTKYDLPSTYVSEMVEYNRLYLLGASRTSTGNPSFTSTSSSTTYTVSDNSGDNGMLVLLQTALASYLFTANDFNTLASDAVVVSATPNKILKLDSNSKLPTSITGDADTVDGLHANSFMLGTKAYGNVTFTDSIGSKATLTKNIALGGTYKHGILIIGKLMVFFGTDNSKTLMVGVGNTSASNSGLAYTRRINGCISNVADDNYFISGQSTIDTNEIFINGTNIDITFYNTYTSSVSLNCSVDWEVW